MQASIIVQNVVQKAISPVLNLLEAVLGKQETPKDIPAVDLLKASAAPHQQEPGQSNFAGDNDHDRNYAYHGYQAWRWRAQYTYMGLSWPSDFHEDEW